MPGWSVAVLLRDMAGFEGQATFENVECIRQRSVDAPRLWLKMAMQMLWNVKELWKKRKMWPHMTDQGGFHHMCSFMWADNYWILSQLKEKLEQMMKELVEEAKRWKLEPKPASLWWTSTYASEEKEDMVIKTEAGEHRLPFTSLEERMQSANKA